MKTIRRITTKQQHNKDNKPPPPIKYLYLEKKEGATAGTLTAGTVTAGTVVTGDPVVGVDGKLAPCVCFVSHVCANEPTELILAPAKSIV